MLAEIIGTLLSGLGLFFTGIKLLSAQMKQAAGRRFRMLVSKATKNPFLAAAWGLVSGTVLQSTTAVTFIVMSLVSADLIPVRRALPLIAWSNVGNSALVLISVLDIRLFTSYLLGIVGLGFYFDLDRSRFRYVIGSLLAIGLIFLGLQLMKSGAAPLNKFEGLQAFIQYVQTSYALMFFIGTFITFIAQSATTISVLAVTMASTGLIGFDQTVMMMYGAHLGSGLNILFLSSNMTGSSRQAALFQSIFKSVGTILFVSLFYLELKSSVPLVKYFVGTLSTDTARQLSYVYLIFQFTTAIVISILSRPIASIVQKISPPTEEEELSKPRYIRDHALEEPETALDLIEKELGRIVTHLPEYLNAIRIDTKDDEFLSCDRLHSGCKSILKEVDGFITDVIDQGVSRSALERCIAAQNLTNLIGSLQESLYEWVQLLREQTSVAEFSHPLTEGLHLALTLIAEELESTEKEKDSFLLTILEDRGEKMKQFREEILKDEQQITYKEQQTLFAMTSIFERMYWLMRRIAILMRQT